MTKTCYAQYMEFLSLCEEAGIEAFVEAADAEEQKWQDRCEVALQAHEDAMKQWSKLQLIGQFGRLSGRSRASRTGSQLEFRPVTR